MAASLTSSVPLEGSAHDAIWNQTQSSAVSWGAVLGGAFVGAALALILLLLGTGLGLSAVSPWSQEGISAETVAVGTIVWIILSHFIASAMSGYVTGRTRTTWIDLKTDEIFFRDTANGLISWAVGMVLTAAFLTNAVSSIVGGVAKAGATTAAAAGASMAATAKQSDGAGIDSNYFVDALFRSVRPTDTEAPREEAGRIIASGLKRGDLSEADRTYLADVVAARTGLNQMEAEKRVDDVIAAVKAAEVQAREAADAARKVAVHTSLWIFLALLIGAVTASYAATVGGKHRDHA